MAAEDTQQAVHAAAVLGVALVLETISTLGQKGLINEAEALDIYKRAVASTPEYHQANARDILQTLVPNAPL